MESRTVRQRVLTVVLAALILSPVMLLTIRAQTAPAGFADLASALTATPAASASKSPEPRASRCFSRFENNAALTW